MTSRWLASWRRNRLFRKYVGPFVGVVLLALLSNGLLEIYFAYQENKSALAQIQREKAVAAAVRIEAFVKDIERQMGWTTQPQLAVAGALEQRRLDYFRLQRQVPAITEVSYLDARGREQLRISRLAMDVIDSGIDLSTAPRFTETRGGATWYGPVYFRKDSEPYMAIAIPHGKGGGVTAAEVNLKFILDVVSQIRIGKFGHAYVVDAGGQLIAHPDISLVLKKTDLSELPQIRAARAASAATAEGWDEGMIATSLDGRRSLVAHTTIAPLGWIVMVEQPLIEAFAPLRGSILRTGLLMLLGVAVSVAASLALAGKMTRPIRALHTGAARIGGGDLAHQIDIKTRDELEDLAGEFNRMTARLRESYATLEQKVEERTRELTEALDQQTATAEILRVISSSPTNVQPVFEAIVSSGVALFEGAAVAVALPEADEVRLAAIAESDPERAARWRERFPFPLSRDYMHASAILDRRVVDVPDVLASTAIAEPGKQNFLASGYRAITIMPMLRGQTAIGAISVIRLSPGALSAKQRVLLKTFADQAVIAIENVRLFKELQSRNAALTRTLEQQTATSEILKVISRSPTDIHPVFDTIVQSAVRLCNARSAAVFRVQDGVLYEPANYGGSPQARAATRARYPRPVDMDTTPGAAILTRSVIQVPDTEASAAVEHVRQSGRLLGIRSLITIPMIREAEALGAIVVTRTEPGAFSEAEVDLLKTFSDQAVIAIENVRLFNEIQEKTRQLEAANRHKDEFLASMSHELRTPLNAVIGFSEVLLERMFGDINEKQEEYLSDILVSGRHLLSLINDILDLAKIEAGRMELDLEDFEVAQAIDNAVVLVRERATRKGLALETTLAPGLGTVRADQRKIKQVLLNLLSNAVKFTPEGGRIEVHAQRLDGVVEVAVRDTGIGIAAEDQEAVFEEFRQVGTDYAKKHEGTGLGLTLSRKFVELHGGHIAVKSRPGDGSTFTFTLPVRHGG